MAKYTYINGSLSALADILEDSGYFDTVTYGSVTSGYAVTCKIGTQTVFYISYTSNQYYDIKVYGVTPSFTSSVNGNMANVYRPSATYECSGGIAIVCGYGRIVITKNQRGETLLIFNTADTSSTSQSSQTVAANMATIGAIAYTDASTFANYKVNTNTSSHTLLIPICSCAAFDTESYTTTVLIAAYKQFTTVGFLTYNNKRYFFDGYFATEDTETSGGAS